MSTFKKNIFFDLLPDEFFNSLRTIVVSVEHSDVVLDETAHVRVFPEILRNKEQPKTEINEHRHLAIWVAKIHLTTLCFNIRWTMEVKRPRTREERGWLWQWRLKAVHISSDGCWRSNNGDKVESRSSSTVCGRRLSFCNKSHGYDSVNSFISGGRGQFPPKSDFTVASSDDISWNGAWAIPLSCSGVVVANSTMLYSTTKQNQSKTFGLVIKSHQKRTLFQLPRQTLTSSCAI